MSELSYWVSLLLLLVLGVLGVSSVILKTKPEAKKMIDALVKISGWLGIGAVIWGAYMFLDSLLTINRLTGLLWLTALVVAAVFVILGFIFGYGMVASVLNEEAKAKGENLRKKLQAYQIPLGWVSLGLFVWWLLVRYAVYY